MPVPPFFPKHSVLSSLPALCTGLGLDLVCAWCFTVGHAPSAQAQPACGPSPLAEHSSQCPQADGPLWESSRIAGAVGFASISVELRSAAEGLYHLHAPPPLPGAGRGGLHIHKSLWQVLVFWVLPVCKQKVVSIVWRVFLRLCHLLATWHILVGFLCILVCILSNQHLSTFLLKCYLIF